MSNNRVSKVPPEGGYGWVITLAYGLNNVCGGYSLLEITTKHLYQNAAYLINLLSGFMTYKYGVSNIHPKWRKLVAWKFNVVVLPLIAGFALVFQEAFDETELTATQGTLVITLNHSIGMLLSFFGGPVLKRFGYRKVAVLGALCVSIGLLLTSMASNFWLFIFSYSIINSTGIAAVMAAFTLAINSYFKEKRSRAIGIGMSLTGLGAILMPLLMSTLMDTYGWRDAVLILSAICLHSLVAACLLRPSKWYLRDPPVVEELAPLNPEIENGEINGLSPIVNNRNTSMPQLTESVGNGVLGTQSYLTKSLPNNSSIHTENSISYPNVRNKTPEVPLSDTKYKWWESQEINLGSSINIFDEKEIMKKLEYKKEEMVKRNFFEKIVDFFDLTLLADPIFVNILFGLSIAACVETNFSLLLPMILKDMLKFETGDIAKLMAIIGLSDTMFRFVAPFIGEWCHKPPRVMYMVSLMLVIFIRTIMLFTTTFTGMIFVALAMGVTKGLRTVYMNVVIPSYVPIERLAFASGIQMFFNGITIFTIGSILGRLRDSSGSYEIPIVVLNIVTFITIVIWSSEFLYIRLKAKSTETSDA